MRVNADPIVKSNRTSLVSLALKCGITRVEGEYGWSGGADSGTGSRPSSRLSIRFMMLTSAVCWVSRGVMS